MNGPGTPGEKQFDFFISYTGRDEAWATWVADQLQDAGYRLQIQAWHFGSGIFLSDMENAVRQCDKLLPILSNGYLISNYSRLEWAAYMHDSASLIIPIQIEKIQDRSLLKPLVRINLIGLGDVAAKDKLLRTIKKLAPPKYAPPDITVRIKTSFPGPARGTPADTGSTTPDAEGTGAGPWPSSAPTLAIDRDRIQLILLGGGEVAGEAVASLLGKFDGTRQLNLLNSDLDAKGQLKQIADEVKGLDPKDVSDLLVIFAGQGSDLPDAGVYLHVSTTDPSQPATTGISLAELLETAQPGRPPWLRSYLILDAVDAEGQAVGDRKSVV